MTPRDFSQVPVEQLARLLLERAQQDPGLPRRTPANSNEAPPGWKPPPVARVSQPWFPERLADRQAFDGQDRLVDLVSQAVTVAQEAEDVAQATREASRRASRGAAFAIALGVLGMVAGISAGFTSLLYDSTRPEIQASADTVQPHLSARPAPTPAQPISGQQAALNSSPDDGPQAVSLMPALAPATFVRVLPAVPSPSEAVVSGYHPYAAQGD